MLKRRVPEHEPLREEAANYPLWTAIVPLRTGTTFRYEYLRREGAAVTWESGGNRIATCPSAVRKRLVRESDVGRG